MTREVSRAEVKALFAALVSRCGGIEAAGARLGISHQRVSQLQHPTNADMPTIMHVVALESFCAEPVVSGALAQAIDGGKAGDLITEGMEASEATMAVQRLIRTGAPDKQIMAAALDAKGEIDDVIASLADRAT